MGFLPVYFCYPDVKKNYKNIKKTKFGPDDDAVAVAAGDDDD